MNLFRSSLLSLILAASPLASSDINLPSIGDSSSGIVSTQKEKELGQVFLKMLHNRVQTNNDPELVSYVESLVYQLAESSQLTDRNLSIVLIESPQLNAFAAPGGVIGINTGLFLYARTEEEFAGVIAHELAHLSQRHYARGVETAKRQALPTMAALLGSVVLAASGAGDLGAAALSTTIAGAQSSQLAFSRDNEREADRVGILTMVRANMDPRAMAGLFERMSKLDGSNPQYEFLRTHPTSRNRVADTRSRAEQYPARKRRDQTNYQLMRNRAFLSLSSSTDQARIRFKEEVETGHSSSLTASKYGYAQVLLDSQDAKSAAPYAKELLKQAPNNIYYRILNSRIEFENGSRDQAIKSLQELLSDNPGNYPAIMTQADLLFKDKQFRKATNILKAESKKRPQDPYIWYQLAEISGLAGDIATVHTSRAEHFFLVGQMDKSILQLQYATELPGLPFSQKAAIRQRIEEVKHFKKAMQL
ncbi:M48 family metalloprotease [Sansalvadorimonas sp. 2012CJ34-2]|uniref:Putative beta-barrel assembly-enhancing protease n=1 Tax=Parendozoicomonas callyspongiae TaxID=2942213 RepID=A0ABT0PFY6_9GAMM|nr:M48 family metalloprotease [Sansalvadorimonas sp. 2012CJ34-2]MCL6270248.1 M48 family metalloprotease [Sansalvadorimonas sp. 2012CJ34-2]